jgi:hypothetical protein
MRCCLCGDFSESKNSKNLLHSQKNRKFNWKNFFSLLSIQAEIFRVFMSISEIRFDRRNFLFEKLSIDKISFVKVSWKFTSCDILIDADGIFGKFTFK